MGDASRDEAENAPQFQNIQSDSQLIREYYQLQLICDLLDRAVIRRLTCARTRVPIEWSELHRGRGV